MLRKLNWVKIFGNFFILFVIAVIAFLYYVFMFIVNYEYLNVHEIRQVSPWRIAYLLYFHFLLIMVIWCYVQTTITDPGKVPSLWGFHLDDTEVKKRRYCLICHIFKPERCHHCSMCNRCVLNMDHHCPWVNNCIGFYNRKYFILLITYALVAILSTFIGLIPSVIHAARDLWYDYHAIENFNNICIMISFTMLCILLFLMVFFVKYHYTLLFTNVTTIEDLERKRSNVVVNYDIGTKYNFLQVFGNNPWLWPLPIYGESGRPLGDGVTWDQRLFTRDVEMGTEERRTEH